jgi:hypothetical protein
MRAQMIGATLHPRYTARRKNEGKAVINCILAMLFVIASLTLMANV